MPIQCLYNVYGEENPKIAPSPWDFVTLPEEDQATAICYMHKKFSKYHMCGYGDMLEDGHTDIQDRHIRAHYKTSPPLPRAK